MTPSERRRSRRAHEATVAEIISPGAIERALAGPPRSRRAEPEPTRLDAQLLWPDGVVSSLWDGRSAFVEWATGFAFIPIEPEPVVVGDLPGFRYMDIFEFCIDAGVVLFADTIVVGDMAPRRCLACRAPTTGAPYCAECDPEYLPKGDR